MKHSQGYPKWFRNISLKLRAIFWVKIFLIRHEFEIRRSANICNRMRCIRFHRTRSSLRKCQPSHVIITTTWPSLTPDTEEKRPNWTFYPTTRRNLLTWKRPENRRHVSLMWSARCFDVRCSQYLGVMYVAETSVGYHRAGNITDCEGRIKSSVGCHRAGNIADC